MKQKQKKKKHSVSEEELLQAIENISKTLAYKFKFGYHELEDMKQQISIYAIEGLENYDYLRPLENFLWTHVRNRLFNFKRDNYQRPTKPCITCPFFDKLCGNQDSNCKKYTEKLDCEAYSNWHSRNNAKKNLMYLNTIEDLKEYIQSKTDLNKNLEIKETIDYLEENLYGEHRTYYLKMKYGNKLYKNELNKLLVKIQEIL